MAKRPTKAPPAPLPAAAAPRKSGRPTSAKPRARKVAPPPESPAETVAQPQTPPPPQPEAADPFAFGADQRHLLAQRAAEDATLATWSVAGGVRRALQDAGFSLSRQTGFAGKRQMLTGHFCPMSGA